MLLTRRKRKEQKKVMYLNNKAIPEAQKLKYLGIIFLLQINILGPHKLYSREMYETNIHTSKVSED